MAKEKEVVTGEVIDSTPEEEAALAKILEEFPEIRSADPEAVMDRMAARMAKAASLDELFDALTGQSSDDLTNRSFEFLGVSWQPYQSDRGIIPMAVCEVADLGTGELAEFVTTAFMLVRFLRRAQQLDQLPFKARIVGKKTNSGKTALNFERV